METLQIKNEQLAIEQEYEKYHWRDRISRKSGAECHYHNGSGHEGEEGLCEADSYSEYDTRKLERFKEAVFVFIEEDLNPFVKKIPEMEFLSIRTYIQSENVVIAEMRITYTYVRYVVQCFNDFGGENNLCNKCLLKKDE